MKPSAFVLILLTSLCQAGQFRFGLGRGESMNAKLANPPAVRIGRTSLSIDVKDGNVTPTAGGYPMAGGGFPGAGGMPSGQPIGAFDPSLPLTQVQAALDQHFSESFTIAQSNGEASLRIAITHHTPAESRIDQMTQRARVPAPPNPDGTPRFDQFGNPEMLQRDIVVEQWSARGQLAARVELVDGSGALLDSFAPQASVRATQIVSADGQDRLDRTKLPPSEQVRDKLIADFVAQLVQRYAPPAEAVEVPLAVDDELRAGNKMAKDGDFEHAVESWTSAVMKKRENIGDPIHNVGVVHEVQAYDMLLRQADPAKIAPYLERAAKQYSEASAADSKEKYFTRASDRIRKAQQRLTRFTELEAARQRAITAKAQPSPWPPGSQPQQQPPPPVVHQPEAQPPPPQQQAPGVPVSSFAPTAAAPAEQPAPQAAAAEPAAVDPAMQEALEQALKDPRADNAQEAAFRQFARLRLKAAQAAPTAELTTQLHAAGAAVYKLTALQARRVVYQESTAWSALQPKLAMYRDSAAAFAQDGQITAEERAALVTMARNLELTDADVKAIESTLKLPQ